jgi:hypothetical protein
VKRPKHKAPVLFGERMRLATHSPDRTIWVRVYGDLSAIIIYKPGAGPFSYGYTLGKRDGVTDTAEAAVRQLENLVRRIGRALPWVATVSRSFARSHGR